MSNIYERCFIFSKEQMDNKIAIETDNGGKKRKLGTVIVNGIPKTYTDIVLSMDKTRFSDSILLLRGDIRTVKYTQPEE